MLFRLMVIAALLAVMVVPAEGACEKGAKAAKGAKGAKAAKAEAKRHRKMASKEEKKRQNTRVDSFSFRQSGGFAGVNKLYEARLADMEKDQRTQLEDLIEESGLLKLTSESKTTPGAADMFFYEFVALDLKGTHKATYDDGTLPKSFRPILEFLRDKLTDTKRR